jgi:hypothetical protein
VFEPEINLGRMRPDMKAATGGGLIRIAGLSALILAATLSATEADGCKKGSEACPAVLHMARGAVSITATGWVSGEQPNYYFQFEARAGQKMTIKVVGGNIKTGPGIPITLPNGTSDAVFENTPYTLPATRNYVILMHANTMSDGPFGTFRMTLTIR